MQKSEIEKTYYYSAYSKGIRLDVYCDGEDEVYNIEMQNYRFDDLPKRGRYYQAMIDKDLLDISREKAEEIITAIND